MLGRVTGFPEWGYWKCEKLEVGKESIGYCVGLPAK